MPKEITLKDVLYALEFGRETLVRHPPAAAGGAPKWELQPSGNRVKVSIADHISASGSVVVVETKLSGWQRLAWRAAA